MARPTHDLCIIRRESKKGGFHNIGVGWKTDGEGIAIQLNDGVVISWRDNKDCAFYIFKKTDGENNDRQNQTDRQRRVVGGNKPSGNG